MNTTAVVTQNARLVESGGESATVGVVPVSGGFLAITFTQSKELKTERAAISWLVRRGYGPSGERI